MSLWERLAAPVGSLCTSALAGALVVCTIPSGPSCEEFFDPTEEGGQRRAKGLELHLKTAGATILSSLFWNVLALLDAPRSYAPTLWAASFAAYVAAFMYRCLVG